MGTTNSINEWRPTVPFLSRNGRDTERYPRLLMSSLVDVHCPAHIIAGCHPLFSGVRIRLTIASSLIDNYLIGDWGRRRRSCGLMSSNEPTNI
jgi:hypothetical protein